MENVKFSGEPVVYIKEERTNLSALNPIDLNIQDEEDESSDRSEHKVYCSLTVVNPDEITYDSVGSDEFNSDWVFGLQNSESNLQPITRTSDTAQLSLENSSDACLIGPGELSNDSLYSKLDNSSSDNSNYTFFPLPNESALVNFNAEEDWNKSVPEQIKLVPAAKKTFICPKCNKVFASRSNLERHSAVHSDVKPFQCVECKKMFARRVHLERHKLLHTDHKPFVCDICKKGFTQKGHLEKHKIVHSGVKPFECANCRKMFARKESLKRHSELRICENKVLTLASGSAQPTQKVPTAQAKQTKVDTGDNRS
ncbi:zinc finger protein 33A [Nilaparvata lugens]|uniref:zinc finger protein 33A n=1 Tax=Nilaparvata lugens TaxID=108931 RepID=UPI00193CEE63|nr:zinc finger protein 33A [Nilaparvata lugens]